MVALWRIFLYTPRDLVFVSLFSINFPNYNNFAGPRSTFSVDLEIFDVYSFWHRKYTDNVMIDGDTAIILLHDYKKLSYF